MLARRRCAFFQLLVSEWRMVKVRAERVSDSIATRTQGRMIYFVNAQIVNA